MSFTKIFPDVITTAKKIFTHYMNDGSLSVNDC